MNQWDILIIFILAAAVFSVILLLIRRKRRGRSCCGDCAFCAASKDRPGTGSEDICPKKEKK